MIAMHQSKLAVDKFAALTLSKHFCPQFCDFLFPDQVIIFVSALSCQIVILDPSIDNHPHLSRKGQKC